MKQICGIFVIILYMVLNISIGNAGTVYIDPTCANNGNGAVGEPCASSSGGLGPRNTWVGVSWVAGNTYAGQGGTSETLSSYIVGGSGLLGSPITITSYGVGKFKFRATSSYTTAIISRSYVVWDKIIFESINTNCLYLTGTSNNITIKNNTFIGCGVGGSAIALEGQNATAKFDNVIIDNNDFTDITGAAIRVQFSNSNALEHSNWVISNNIMDNVANGASNIGGIYISMDAGTTATMTNLNIFGNVITATNDEEISPVHAIQLVRSVTGTIHEDRYLGVKIYNNTIMHGGGGISVAHVSSYSGVYSQIYGNEISDINSTAGIITFYSKDLDIFANKISEVKTYPAISNIDGIGIDLDLGNTNVWVYRNVVLDCVGNSGVESSGQGIAIFGSNTNYVFGNLLVRNRHSIVFGDDNAGIAGVPNYIENNTIVNSALDGISTVFSVEQVNIIRNNIIVGSGRYGISSVGTGMQTLQANILYGNIGGDYNSQTPGTTDILNDPGFVSNTDYRLQRNSIGRRAGVSGGTCVDVRGRSCYSIRPDIGAYQFIGGAPTENMTPYVR